MKNLILIAHSNEGQSSLSFSPSELFVCPVTGACYEESYSSRRSAEEWGGSSLEPVGYLSEQKGFWRVSRHELLTRFFAIWSA